ncbi:hypothetical protein [Nocardioides sp. 1609]|uniref:hypothetical protein n=1 Tax=Nocardioides sp. 1609 TaxID=2508327 RepID=UPI0010704DA2|nr:hypothetical protein [Nocardioides sp. 1609]QCW51997.1 hypothetical protein FE634_19175 [Nocardioides sp. S-1144]
MAARGVGLLLAGILVAVGVLWTLQGLGYVDGGFTSGRTWATIGPLVAGFGVALGFVLLRPRR